LNNLITISSDWEQSFAKPMGYLVANFEPRDHDDDYCLCRSRETADDHAAEQIQKALDAGEVHEIWPVYPVYAGVPPEGDETPLDPQAPLPIGCKNLPADRDMSLCPFGCLGEVKHEGKHSQYVYVWECGTSCMRLASGDVGAPIPGDLQQTKLCSLRLTRVLHEKLLRSIREALLTAVRDVAGLVEGMPEWELTSQLDVGQLIASLIQSAWQVEKVYDDLRQQIRQFLSYPNRLDKGPSQLADFIVLCDDMGDNAWSRSQEELAALLAGQFKPDAQERPCPPE
jgi:hypothetical protein